MRGKRTRIGELVDGALRRWNLERGVRERRAMLLWPSLVGDDIARNAVPTGIKDHVLLVSASNHAWAQTLDLMKPQVLQRLREHLGEEVLRDIHFSAGRWPKRKPAPPTEPEPAGTALSAEQRSEIERAAAAIEDPELRAQVERAFASLVQARRRFREQGYRICEGCGALVRGKGRACSRCGQGRQVRRGRGPGAEKED